MVRVCFHSVFLLRGVSYVAEHKSVGGVHLTVQDNGRQAGEYPLLFEDDPIRTAQLCGAAYFAPVLVLWYWDYEKVKLDMEGESVFGMSETNDLAKSRFFISLPSNKY